MFCKMCNTEKSEDDFPKNRSKPSGRGFYCNKCMYERLKEWRSKNPDKVKKIQKVRYDRLHKPAEQV